MNTNPRWPWHFRDGTAAIFESFGRFINKYAQAEAIIHVLFRHFTGLEDEAARAISGGMRLSDIMTWVKRLIAINEVTEKTKAEIHDIFTHFDTIGKLRHNLIHRYAVVVDDSYITVNSMTSKSRDETEMLRASLDDIVNATSDLQVVYMRLLPIMYPNNPYFQEPEQKQYQSYTWRYKHLEPMKMKKPRPSNPLLSLPQPQS